MRASLVHLILLLLTLNAVGEPSVKKGMSYDEVLEAIGLPTMVRFTGGHVQFYYEGAQVHFEHAQVARSYGFPGDGSGEFLPTFSEAIIAKEDGTGRFEDRRYVVGWPLVDVKETRNYQAIFDGGYLRGLRRVKRVTYCSGDVGVSGPNFDFRVGSPTANPDGWYNPKPFIWTECKDGVVVDIEVYVDKNDLFAALRSCQASRGWFL